MSRRLAIVLHTHLPYVEGFGTWPFGEEWLWEAVATSYLPLAAALDAQPGRVTLSVTPVLADQLEAPGVTARCLAFLRGMREETHRLDLEAHPEVAAPLAWSRDRYRWAAGRLAERDVLAALAPHVTWTSSATHAVLPLLATDAGLERQVRIGLEAGRRRFPGVTDGFWLPECAHDPALDPLLAEAGVGAGVVELPGGPGRDAVRWAGGPVLFPLHRGLVDLVWGRAGYPSRAAYLDTHHHTDRRHLAWAVDGTVYDPARAAAQARADAAEFLAAVPADGLATFAIDTELLGHFWAEGVTWLAEVLGQADEAGVEVVPLPAADAPVTALDGGPTTTWGHPPTLATWSAPAAQGLAWTQRRLELQVAAARGAADERAQRELLALQSSDWAFLATHGTAGPYPLERAAGHAAQLEAALAAPGASDPAVRGLAPVL